MQFNRRNRWFSEDPDLLYRWQTLLNKLFSKTLAVEAQLSDSA
jgi:hypothetical protein